jgi:PhnB protein
MENSDLPQGHQTVMPYLVLENALGFFDFTKNVFGAKENSKHLMEDGSLMHGEIIIGGSTIMFGNASEKWPVQNSGLFINVDDADKIFRKAIEQGAKLLMELTDQPYGRSGGVRDPFGNTWWITKPV